MKKIALWLGIGIIAVLIWYFLIKPYDYLVRFEIKTYPGTVNQMIKIWNDAMENPGTLEQTSLYELNQTLTFNDSTHIYHWQIRKLNDSTSRVRVYARDTEHSFSNKLNIPFRDTDFEKRTRKTLIDFSEKLQEHVDRFRVTFLGEEEIPGKFCAYTIVKSSQYGKASGMMNDYNFLGGQLTRNNIELDGTPIVDIVEWDIENDSLVFHFCYPIVKTDSLPDLGEIKYKEIEPVKALKAEFNGNYIFSDRAWYYLRDYARENGLEVTDKPLEIFYNNPNMGGDELRWKAEIYMPIAE